MKLGFAIFALLGFASPVYAGADFTWDNCVVPEAGEPTPTYDQTFDCTTSRSYKLYGCFKTPTEMPDFNWLDFSINFTWPGTDRYEALHPFWHFQDGGCNQSGLALSIDKSSSGVGQGGCGHFVSPWGENGSEAMIYSTQYSPALNGHAGLGRLIGSIVRPADSPFPLHPGINYYGFQLTFNTEHRGGCEGCTDRIRLDLLNIVLISATHVEVLLLSDKGRMPDWIAFVTINAEGQPTPVLNTTWGQIKSQYR